MKEEREWVAGQSLLRFTSQAFQREEDLCAVDLFDQRFSSVAGSLVSGLSVGVSANAWDDLSPCS